MGTGGFMGVNRMRIDCPCCGGEIEARHTEKLSATMRRMYFVCDECGYRTPAGMEILFSICAPARPRADVQLEVRTSADRLRGAVNARTTGALAGAA